MKKEIHLKVNPVNFICASCNSSYTINSTLTNKDVTIDICSSCHPFYLGTIINQQVKGRAEKFNKKVVDPSTASKTKTPKTKNNQKQKVIKSLNNL